jgi:hypothetical protein
VVVEEGPRTSIGRGFREQLKKHLLGTDSWEAFKKEHLASFRQTASLHDLGSAMVGEALGAFLDGIPSPEGEAGRETVRILKKVGKEAIKKYYELRCAEFETAIAKGQDPLVLLARMDGGRENFKLLAERQLSLLQSLGDIMPSAEGTVAAVSDHPPRLRERRPNPLTLLDLSPRGKEASELLQLADGISTFDDFFPGRDGAYEDSARTRVLQYWKSQGNLSTETAAGLDEALKGERRVEPKLVSIATNSIALDGYDRVGGVVIGKDAGSVKPTGIDGIRWRIAGDQITIELPRSGGPVYRLGAFRSDIVRAALAYAADDRRTAVTVISATNPDTNRPGLRVLLHPALIDTPLGNSLLKLDEFAYDSTDESEERRATEESLTVQDTLFHGAVWARLAALDDPESQAGLDRWASSFTPQGKAIVARLLRDKKFWLDPTRCILIAKSEFYDRETVHYMLTAVEQGVEDPENLGKAVKTLARTQSRESLRALGDWIEADPDLEFRSGVRERPYSVDSSLAFVEPDGDKLWPFHFKILATFDAFPINVQGPQGDFARPWDFPERGDLKVNESVESWVRDSPSRQDVLQDARSFTLLQRLFRNALTGAFGEDFPVERLAALSRSLRNLPNLREESVRWTQ